MKRQQKYRPYLTPNEVADLLMVSPITVRQWAQKGQLKAETTLGGHRRFMRQEVQRFAREHGLALQQPDQAQTRILIVDDDRLVNDSLTALFEDYTGSVQVEVAYDGFDAGRKVSSFQPHIILLDLLMPGLDGFEVCSRLKADPVTKTIRIIAMTGYPAKENSQRILQAGAELCLAKPLDIEALLRAMDLTEPASRALKA